MSIHAIAAMVFVYTIGVSVGLVILVCALWCVYSVFEHVVKSLPKLIKDFNTAKAEWHKLVNGGKP